MIEIRKKDFSIDETIKKLKNPKTGGIVTYLGTVREISKDGKEVRNMEFTLNDDAKKKLKKIEKRARDKFDIQNVVIIHRTGSLGISENILFIEVSSSHREPAFHASMFIIDSIKNEVHRPPWKKEILK